MSFKVGDYVTCVDNENIEPYLSMWSDYVVLDVSTAYTNCVMVTLENGLDAYVENKYFVRAATASQTQAVAMTYSLGDTVIVKATGEKGTIHGINRISSLYLVHKIGSTVDVYYAGSELQPSIVPLTASSPIKTPKFQVGDGVRSGPSMHATIYRVVNPDYLPPSHPPTVEVRDAWGQSSFFDEDDLYLVFPASAAANNPPASIPPVPLSSINNATAAIARFQDEIGKPRLSVCDHTYSQYVGLMTSYQYCTKCDHKKENS